MGRRVVHLHIDMEVDEVWVGGTASDASGGQLPFSGWLGLIGAIGRLVDSEAAPRAVEARLPGERGQPDSGSSGA